MQQELIIKGVNTPFQINIQTVNDYIKEASTNIELAKNSKKEQEKQGNKLSYTNYTALIKFIKNREEESDSIVNKIKNKELEDIERVLGDFKGYLRVWRLELEKEQKKYKDDFLLDARIDIKNKAKSILDDVCVNLPTIFKNSNYNSFIESIVEHLVKGFIKVHADSFNNVKQSILNDMAIAYKTQAIINKIYEDVGDNNILNSGVVVDMFDYFDIENFDILIFAERKKQEAELILQKQKEEEQRQLLLKQRQEEDNYTVRDSYNELLDFVKNSVAGLSSRTPILKEIWERRDSGVVNDENFTNYIKDKVDCLNGKRPTRNIVDVEPTPQPQPTQQNTGFITKDYYFDNQNLIVEMSKILKENCRFREVTINGKIRYVITGFIN